MTDVKENVIAETEEKKTAAKGKNTKKDEPATEKVEIKGAFSKPSAAAGRGRTNYRPKSAEFRGGGKITIDGDNKYKKPATEDDNITKELQMSLDRNVRLKLEGVVTGFRPVRRTANEEPNIFATVDFHGRTVLIHSRDFALPIFDPETKEYKAYTNENFPVSEIIKYVQRRKFSEVDFIVNKVDVDNFGALLIIASRLAGMAKQRQRYWYAKEKNTGKDYIRAGKVAQARVVAVVKDSIFVELFGCETRIPAKNLSYVFLRDVRDHFKNGDTVEVLITEVNTTQTEKGKHIDFRASYKETQYDLYRSYFLQHRPGDNVVGKVMHVKYNEKENLFEIFVNVNNQNRVQVVCNMKRGVEQPPAVEDWVDIKILKMDPETLKARGELIHVYSR